MRLSLIPVLALLGCNPIHAANEFLAARPTSTAVPVSAAPASTPVVSQSPSLVDSVPLNPALVVTSVSTPAPSPTGAQLIPVAPMPVTTGGFQLVSNKYPTSTEPTSRPGPVVAYLTTNPPEKPKPAARVEVKAVVESTPSVKAPTHKLRRGENLTRVAAAHGIPLNGLSAANSYTLDDRPFADVTIVLASGTGGTWTVRKHQTLSQIGETVGIPLAELVAVNGLADADSIKAGDILTIPVR